MIALLKLSPIFLLAGLMMVSNLGDIGLDILVIAPIATIYAAIIAMVTGKFKFQEILDAAIDNVKDMQFIFFILMVSYAMAEAFMATGVGASIINMALSVGVTGKTVALAAFLVASALSIATGSSWGTFAACAPVFLWLNHILGGDLILTACSIAGGTCFGDCIGLISDTTIISSAIQKVDLIDRVRHQGGWSLSCLILAAIVIFIAGSGLPSQTVNAVEVIDQIPEEVWTTLSVERPSAVSLLNQVKAGVPYYMIIPLILVLVFAFKGFNTLICLGAGIVGSYILGMVAGTVESGLSFLDLVYTGFSDAGSWVIVMMMWVGAFGGIMLKMNAFDPIKKLVVKLVTNVRQLMFANALLCLLGNAALADETCQIVTIGPIIKEITDENVEVSEEEMYKLRLRNATMSDALGVYSSQLFPWHVYLVFYAGIASSIYPLYTFKPTTFIGQNYLSIIAVASMLILTLTGWDRFIPGFRIPSEPTAHLKKNQLLKAKLKRNIKTEPETVS